MITDESIYPIASKITTTGHVSSIKWPQHPSGPHRGPYSDQVGSV